MAGAGFERPELQRAWHGAHGTLYTEQRWESITAYEASRGVVRQTPAITGVFDQIYPLLASTHNTEILEAVE